MTDLPDVRLNTDRVKSSQSVPLSLATLQEKSGVALENIILQKQVLMLPGQKAPRTRSSLRKEKDII